MSSSKQLHKGGDPFGVSNRSSVDFSHTKGVEKVTNFSPQVGQSPEKFESVELTPFLIYNADLSAINELKGNVTFGIKNAERCKKHKSRVVTQEKKWIVQPEDYLPEKQWNHMFGDVFESKLRNLSIRQITAKIGGYRAQDIKNTLYDTEKFVDMDCVLNLLKTSEMKCFYCKKYVQVLYQNVREPEQWTLERLNNDEGHNKSNVVIACLNCNLRRRCMYHERYVFTKQLNVVKLDHFNQKTEGLQQLTQKVGSLPDEFCPNDEN